MILIIHSDTSYLSEPKALRRAVGHFIIWYQNSKNNIETNSFVHTVSNFKKCDGISHTAEVGDLFQNVQ